MAVVDGVDALDRSLGRLFVVIGVFDGLHLGHEYLLRELVAAAAAHDARPAVITFDHHPDEILTGHAPPLLCDPDDRLERLEAAGVAVTVVQTFDVALRETPFDAFVRRIADQVDLAGFLMTPDSAFGFERGGTPETVAALGRELGYDVVVASPFTLGGRPVSSSMIRTAIAGGDLASAARLLGRPYAIVGHGSRATRDPVLTFEMPVALPPTGWYAVHIDDLDEAEAHGADHVHVDAPGTVRLQGIWIGGPRWRVQFEPTAAG
ncbi:MAG: FAD synthetase family protein [Candidatus Limnocylindrales bacterium]